VKILTILIAAALSAGAAQAAPMKKCVDDKGRVYYGDSIPPEVEAKCRSTSEMTSRGMEKKKTTHLTDEEKQAQADEALKQKEGEQKAVEQQRRDKALLFSYSNEKEIDLARNRNLVATQAQIDGTQMRINSVQGRLDGLRKQSDSHVKSKKPVPADLQAEIASAEAEIRKFQDSMAKSKQELEATKARFDDDKKRFRELKGLPPVAATTTSSQPAAAPQAPAKPVK
jgi:chromosome segregation ATPase